MPLDNCATCGRVFNRTHRDVCPACWENEQALVDRIADFLNVHPKAGPDEILSGLGIPQSEIVRLLRRGRLMGYEQLACLLVCERCGAQVDRGTLCSACRAVVLELAGPPRDDDVGDSRPLSGRPGQLPGRSTPPRSASPSAGPGTGRLPRSGFGNGR